MTIKYSVVEFKTDSVYEPIDTIKERVTALSEKDKAVILDCLERIEDLCGQLKNEMLSYKDKCFMNGL